MLDRRRACGFLTIAALAAVLPGAPARASDAPVWRALAAGGLVVLVRHAITVPGTGDPPGFRLEDCATQRNLSDEGRAQARRFGEGLRRRAVPVARVLSSPWCRCVETAELAFGARPGTHAALANLHGRGDNAARQRAQFAKLIAQAPRGGNLFLVTHGSTTIALTGEYPQMGEAIVIRPTGGGAFSVVGRIAP